MICVHFSAHIINLTFMILFMPYMIQWYSDTISHNRQTFTKTVKSELLKQNVILGSNSKAFRDKKGTLTYHKTVYPASETCAQSCSWPFYPQYHNTKK